MISLRRRAVLLGGLFCLNLTTTVVGAECVAQSRGDAGGAMASMPGMARDEAQPTNSGSTGQGQLPTDGPRVPDECSTLVICSLAVLPSASEQRIGVDAPKDGPTLASLLVPQSRSVRPEPPPPRA